MADQPQFERTYEQFKEQAPVVFLRDGVHLTIAVICGADGEASLIPLARANAEEKRELLDWLVSEFRQQAQWYVYVYEAWQILMPPLDDLIGQPAPSVNENRVEVLNVSAAHQDGRRMAISWLIKRDPLRLEQQRESGGARADPNMEAALFGHEWHGIVIDEDNRFRLQ
jgi:hypothetical protein